MDDDTRLTPGEVTRVIPSESTRLVPPDATRVSADETVVIGTAGDETTVVEEATIVSAHPVDDLSEVKVRAKVPHLTEAESSPVLLVPGGESFTLHRAIAVGRRPVTPLIPTERILLLTWDPNDTEVSGTHVLLEPTERGVAVTDLGSTNGTRVIERGRTSRRLGPRESCLVTGEATVEFGRHGKMVIVPARR